MTKQISRAGGLLLAMLLALSMLTVCAGADTTDNWTDHAGDTTWYTDNVDIPSYTIDTPEKLAGVAKLVNSGTTDFSGKPLTIAATLDMSNYFWVPIGTEEYPFLGTIRSADGAVVHKINGLKINTAYSNTGFVGYLGSGGEVSRLTLNGAIDVAANSTANIGGVCGYAVAGSKINSVTSNLAITVTGIGMVNVGGIVGAGSCALSKCVNGDATRKADGSLENPTFGALTVTAASANVGGIVGEVDGVTVKANIQDGETRNNANLTVTADTANVGGIAGSVPNGKTLNFTSESGDSTEIDNDAGYVWSLGEKITVTSDTAANVGGYIGSVSGGANIINNAINNAVFLHEIEVKGTGAANVGGIVGFGSGNSISNASLTTSLTKTGLNSTTMLEEHSKTTKIAVTSTGAVCTGGIVGKAEDTTISGASVGDANPPAKSAQTTVISTGTVGGLVGSLDAASAMTGGKVQYAVVEGNAATNVGSAVGSNATVQLTVEVQDVTLTATNMTGGNVGGVFGSNSAALNETNLTKMENLTVTATGADGTLGGVVGSNTGALTSSEYSNTTGKLKLKQILVMSHLTNGAVGGVAGRTTAKIEGLFCEHIDGMICSIGISFDKEGSYVGGIAGKSSATIGKSYAEITITGKAEGKNSTVGGAVGLNEGAGTLENVNLIGTITTNADGCVLGGAIGQNGGTLEHFSLGDALTLKVSNGDGSTLGGLVGKNTGTLTFCYSSAELVSLQIAKSLTMGGLVGENSGTVSASYRDVAVTLSTSGTDAAASYVGGLIGKNSGTVEKCYVSVPVTAPGRTYTCAGGLIGWMSAGSAANCYTCAEVSANTDSAYVGGFIGEFDAGTITNCYSTAEVKHEGVAPAGGFFGRCDAGTSDGLSRCLYAQTDGGFNDGLKDSGGGTMTELSAPAALKKLPREDFADQAALEKEATGWDFSAVWRYGSSDEAAAYHYPELRRTADVDYVNYDLKWYATPDEEGNYSISKESELAGLAALVNGAVAGYLQNSFEGKTVTLTGPIYMQSTKWVGIGNGSGAEFEGTLDGGDFLISGLSMKNNTMAGLFGNMAGTVQNLTLEPFAVEGSGKTAALAANNSGTITNVTVNLNGAASITGGQYVGGIAANSTGAMNNVTLNLTGTAAISGVNSVGGIVGNTTGAITGATVAINMTGAASITASGTGSYAGGIAGKTTADIMTAEVTLTGVGASITGVQYAGGIAGNTTGAIEHSTVALTGTAGEAKITASGNASYAGGIAGKAANITGTAEVPVSVTLTGATVSITGVQYAGGIAGDTTGAIEHSTVALTGTAGEAKITASGTGSYAGGIVGNTTGAIEHSTVALDGTTGAASITASGDASYAGGIAGKAASITGTAEAPVSVTLTGATVSITGVQYAGGIAGNTTGAIEHTTVALDGTTGAASITASGTGSYAGGIAGKAASITGTAAAPVSVTLTGATVSITGVQYAGGIAGNTTGAIEHSTVALDGTTGAASITGGQYAGGIAGNATGAIEHSTVALTGTAGEAKITASGDASHAGGIAGKTTADITTAEVTLTGVGASITGGKYVGGIAGNTTGAIEHSTVALTGTTGAASITVSAADETYVGGIAGKADKLISNGSVTLTGAGASITGGQYVGGIVGNTENSITGATVSIDGKTGEASVTGTTNVGGIAGKMTGTITGTATAPVSVTLTGATVSVTGTTYVGGIAGELNGTIIGAEDGQVFVRLDGAAVTVTGTANVGGAVGSLTGSISYVDVILKNATLSATAADALLGGAVGDAKTGALTHVQVKLENSAITAASGSYTGSLGGVVGRSAADSTVANAKLIVVNGEGFTAPNLSAKGGSVGGIVGTDMGTLTGELDVSAVEVNGARLSLTGAGSVGGVAGSLATARYSGLAVKTTAIAVTNGKNVNVGGIAGQLTNSVVYGAECADSGVSVTTGSGAYTVNVGGAVGLLTINDNNTKLYTVSGANAYQGLNTVTVSGVTLSASGAGNKADANVGGLVGKNVSGSVYNCVVRDSATTQGRTSAISNVSGYLNAKVGGGVGSAEDADSYLLNNTVKCGIKAESCAVYRVGGLIGELQKATVRYNDVQQAAITVGKAVRLDGSSPATDVGGFVGRVNDTQGVGNNTARADVSVSCDNSDNIVYVGGFVGKMGDAGSNVKLFASYATGSVSVGGTAYGAYVGGFVGNAVAGEIASCYATGNADGQASEVRCGGFAGTVNGTTTDKAKVHNAYALGTTFNASGNTAYCGGFAGYNNGILSAVYTTVEDAGVTCDKEYKGVLFGKSDSAVTGAYTKDGLTGGRLSGMDFDGAWAYLTGQNEGRPVLTAIHGLTMRPNLTLVYKPLVEEYLTVGTLEELGAVNCMLNDEDFYKLFSDGRAGLPPILIKLTADLSLAGKIWTPIESLRMGDIFEGNGKTISDLCRDAHGFVKTNSGTIQNLTLANAEVTGGSNVGLVCGTNSGTLRNVTVTGAKLTGTGGGLICGTNDGTLSDVSVSKSTLIGGASYAGGVCGVNNESKSITNASVDATVSVAATYVGGVVGENKGTVENAKVATADTSLMGASLTGGIAALNDTSGTVQTSALWGDITVAPLSGARTVGGIVGDNKGTVTKCYDQAKLSVGKVAATVGGIVGTNTGTGTVSDCFTASGAVIRADGIQAGTTNKEIVGGIVGESTGGTLERCMNLAQVFVSKNAGYVTGQTFFGAIGGQISGTTLTNNLFDRQYSGSAIAYYNNEDAPVRNPNDAKVKAYYTQEMTKAVLPTELSGGNWTAAAGRFPILACFAEDPQALPCVSPGGAATGEVYQERCAAPTGLTSQYFKEGTTVTVTLACATENAEIYYTTDGSMPDETKTKYNEPIPINATTTLKAIAIKPHCADSPVVAATYTEGEPPVTGGGGGAAPVSDKATVVVDGVEYDFGAGTTENGVTSVTPDTKKLNAQIASAATGGTVMVRIEKSADADTVAATLSLKSVETMAQKAMTPAVQAGSVSYELPAAAIDAKALVTALGAADTAEVSLSIAIKELPTTAVTLSSGTLVGQPVQFSVTAACGGKTTEVKTFESYVRRVIELTAQQAARVTTAVVLENGVQRPVPTRVYQKDGKWYAEISSLTNSTYALISNQVSFTDAAGKWFAPMVTELAGRGIISGRSNGIFDGEAGVTRAEFAAIVVKALGLPADGDASKFADVPRGAWYAGAVGKAYEYGLVSGDETGRFTPETGITRQEAMVIVRGAAALTGFAGTSGTLDGFPDVASIDAWALDAARWNVGSGLIQGDEAGRLCGQDKITRGEATTVILRLLQKSGLV